MHQHTHTSNHILNREILNTLGKKSQLTHTFSQYLIHTHPLNPLSDHEQTKSKNSSRKNFQDFESNKENHGVRRTRTEPRNNKDLRLKPRTPQQCLRPTLGFRLSHYKEEVLIIAICGRKQIVPCDYHFSRNVKV